jgi:hypothetical protein
MDELFDDWGEIRWEEAQEALDEFLSLLNDGVPRLQVERSIDVLEWEGRKGVYLLYGPTDQLLYIGFTLVGFKNRRKHHERKFESEHLDVIVFPEKFVFLAPALEVFLNRRLRPMFSGQGNYV